MYQNGLQKIEHELDIRYIAKELRTLRFISKTLLKKYQRQLLPYFKLNLLNIKKVEKIKLLKSDILEDCLSKAIENKELSKIDQRILKNIELSDDETKPKSPNKNKEKQIDPNLDGETFIKVDI